MITPLILLFVSVLLFVFTFKNRERGKNGKKSVKFSLENLPGPKHYPIIGCALELAMPMEKYYSYALSVPKRFGDRLYVHAVGFNFIMLSNPDEIEKLLSSPHHINKGTSYKFLFPWLANGLITSQGKQWHSRRKMLTSAFHFRILDDFLETFDDKSHVLVEVLRKDFADGQARNFCPYMYRCALDIIGETAMGKNFECQKSGDTTYLNAVETACEAVVYRATRPHLWIDSIFYLTPFGKKYKAAVKTLHDFTDEVIKERKAARGRTLVRKLSRTFSDEIYWHGRRRMAFLDLLLEAQKNPMNGLTDRDIREEVDTFMFAGHDTSSTSLNWTIFLLGCHPEYQTLVQEELDGIFGDDKTRPILTKDLAEMKYLEMCIKESLRLFPLVAVFSRSLPSDLVIDEEFTIPVGFDVAVLPLLVHRNETIYPNPEVYDPHRFLPENCKSRHPFAFLPFSAGPRNCIGQKFAMMEMKVVLANLFRNFKVEAAQRLEDIVVMLEVMTRPRDGLKIRLLPR